MAYLRCDSSAAAIAFWYNSNPRSIGCRSSVAALAFVEQDSASADRSRQSGSGSPLLILTEDRQYLIATSGRAADAFTANAKADLTLAHGMPCLRFFAETGAVLRQRMVAVSGNISYLPVHILASLAITLAARE